MKKNIYKQVFTGTFIGLGLGILLIVLPLRWMLEPDLDIPQTDEEICVQETFKQPYRRYGYYQLYFNGCMNKKEGKVSEIPNTSDSGYVEVEITG